ncbi:MAG: 1-deoxy-D-xylulose-5-phosphate reductoisomerase [Clostridia bacterium]|nr:1-deoxy-D-xylulose-5-phosphate reductoisomerase [Clostridia bacterium]
MEKLILLGASGSIGTQAQDVAARYHVPIDGLAVNTNTAQLEEAVRKFSPKYAVIVNEASYRDAKLRLHDTDTKLLCKKEGIGEMIASSDADTVLNAIVGEAGLRPTVWALQHKKRLALANKESLVCAGEIVMAMARENDQEILPVDSEHCAIHECLRSGRRCEIDELLITASGGPFFGYTKEEMRHVTREMALNHPTWKMGQKITVDSATLMNKGFELIEAAHLFGVPMEKITPIVHRESIIHSMVRFTDGSILGQMGNPDMRHCIAYALFYPERRAVGTKPLDFVSLGKMTFFAPDTEAFPLLALAKEAYQMGGVAPAVLNAANEEAVWAFLDNRLEFFEIADIVSEAVHTHTVSGTPTLQAIENASQEVRASLRERFSR